MKLPVDICKECHKGQMCLDDMPCHDRVKNLSEFRKFENKMKRRIKQGWKRAYGLQMHPTELAIIAESVMKFLMEE